MWQDRGEIEEGKGGREGEGGRVRGSKREGGKQFPLLVVRVFSL